MKGILPEHVLQKLIKQPWQCTLAAGAEATNAIEVSGTILDSKGQAIADAVEVIVYDASGDVILVNSTPADGKLDSLAVKASNGEDLSGSITDDDLAWKKFIPKSDGTFILTLTHANGAETMTVKIYNSMNEEIGSLAITFAA